MVALVAGRVVSIPAKHDSQCIMDHSQTTGVSRECWGMAWNNQFRSQRTTDEPKQAETGNLA